MGCPLRAQSGISLLSLLAAGAAASADPVTLYQNDFESGTLGPEFSGKKVALSEHPNFSTYMGRFAQSEWFRLTIDLPPLGATAPAGDTVIPDLGGIGDTGETDGDIGGDDDGGGDDGGGDDGGGDDTDGPTPFLLTFDFYAIDSWDGSDTTWGPDTFRVLVDGEPLFVETFANQHGNQTFEGEPDEGGANLGYNHWNDSIYRGIEVPFEVGPGATVVEIVFGGKGLQPMPDESWGVDNVNVSYQVVPLPGAAWAGLAGLAGLTALRRRFM